MLNISFMISDHFIYPLNNGSMQPAPLEGLSPFIITTNDFVYSLPDDLGSSYADVVLHRLSANTKYSHKFAIHQAHFLLYCLYLLLV